MPSKPKTEPTLPLGVEERRRRVEQVRALDRELRVIENAVLDAMARLPKLLHDVQKVRRTIGENTAPASAAEAEEGTAG